MLSDARTLEAAGVLAIVLEAVPAKLAKTITNALAIPTIGIGAGPACEGQVLVLYDLLGLFDQFVPKFVKPYAHLRANALQALRRYREEVDQGKFPTDQREVSRIPLSDPQALTLVRRPLLTRERPHSSIYHVDTEGMTV